MAPQKRSKRKSSKNSRPPKAGARASWRGMIRFGLVSIPAEAFNAHAMEQDHPTFHLLHAKCHSRIRYQKTCPIHGPVESDEIVNGFETSKGRYVEIEPEELEEARTKKEKSITIDAFVDEGQIDPFFYDG